MCGPARYGKGKGSDGHLQLVQQLGWHGTAEHTHARPKRCGERVARRRFDEQLYGDLAPVGLDRDGEARRYRRCLFRRRMHTPTETSVRTSMRRGTDQVNHLWPRVYANGLLVAHASSVGRK